MKKISAKTFDGKYWSGWSNSKEEQLIDIADAIQKIKNDPEQGFIIIDADNLRIAVSDLKYMGRAIKSAKINFNVDIPIQNIILGYPAG